MATAVAGFNADDFREGIRLAMRVGLPPDLTDQPTFVFPLTFVNDSPLDDEDVPFDPAARPVATPSKTSVKVPCAVEYIDAAGKVENFGVVVNSKVVLTFLDEDYEAVKGFAYVVIGGERYFYRKTQPPLGLDSVAIWQVHCEAEDDV